MTARDESVSVFESPARPAEVETIAALDGLRALAILAVFVQHLGDRYLAFVEAAGGRSLSPVIIAWVTPVLRHAYWGVDLFFVLSGFSLSLRYLGAVNGKHAAPTKSHFFARRATRILPGFFAAIGVVLCFTPSLLHAQGLGAALLAHATLLQGYLRAGGVVFIGAAWSLTTEAHFYLAMPWLAPWLFRRGLDGRVSVRRAVVCGGVVCFTVWTLRAIFHDAVLVPGVVTPWLETTQRHWIVCRLDQFVLGMVAACAWKNSERRHNGVLAFAVLAALVVAFRLDGQYYLRPGGSWPYILISLLTAAFVWAAASAKRANMPWLTARPVRAFGIISYGIFLYHQLALRLVEDASWMAGPPNWTNFTLTFVLGWLVSAAFATASWILVERPALRAVNRLLSRPSASFGPPRGAGAPRAHSTGPRTPTQPRALAEDRSA